MTIQDLEYIQHLERELKSYKAEVCAAQGALKSARQELEAIKRERNVAVNMLESLKTCDTCINRIDDETIYLPDDCFLCVNMNKHKFRSVCPENTEAQNND